MIKVGGRSTPKGIHLHSPYGVSFAGMKNGGVFVKAKKFSVKKQLRVKKMAKIPFVRGLYSLFCISKAMIVVLLLLFGVSIASLWVDMLVCIPEWVLFAAEALLVVLVILYVVFSRGFHAAEHMAISAHEGGLPITSEAIRTSSRLSYRCGTNVAVFMVLFCIIGIAICFAFSFEYYEIVLLISLALATEIFKIKNGPQKPVLKYLYRFSMFIQKHVVTKEPTDNQVECAKLAMLALLEL